MRPGGGLSRLNSIGPAWGLRTVVMVANTEPPAGTLNVSSEAASENCGGLAWTAMR